MKFAGLGIVASALLVSGCASSLVSIADGQAKPQSAELRSHMVAGTLGGDGNIRKVTDRTSKGVVTSATVNLYEGAATSTEFNFGGGMDKGTAIPNTGRMPISEATAKKVIDGEELKESDFVYRSGDAFLQVVNSGEGFVAGRLRNKSGETGFLGYVVAGEPTKKGSIPSNGTATYKGDAVATIFGSRSGMQAAKGKSEVNVDFAPGERTVSGKLTKIKVGGKTQGFQVQLRESKISGNTYSGKMRVSEGSTKSSNYAGGFYGDKAGGTAGTFHFRANSVTLLGKKQNIEAVGTFGGNK